MDDLGVAIGLVLVIEGLVWAISPRFGRSHLEADTETPESSLRLAGTLAVTAGVLLVWLIRG